MAFSVVDPANAMCPRWPSASEPLARVAVSTRALLPASSRQAMTKSRSRAHFQPGPQYRWLALSNTTLGVLAATLNSSILLISLPPIFRGIDLDPLAPANINYLLWMIMGYMIATSVL